MKTIPDEKQLEELLGTIPPETGEGTHPKLVSAPWTPRAVSRRRSAWLVTAVVAALALLFSATPPGRAWAQEILHFFSRAESDVLPLQPFQMTAIAADKAAATPIIETVTSVPDEGFDFKLTVEQAGHKAGFDVMTPAWIPETLSFVGASYEQDHNIVRISYHHNKYPDVRNGLVLREERFKTFDDCSLCGVVGASEPIETVSIGETTGEYMIGVWILTDTGPVWESTSLLQTLRWRKNGLAFELSYMGVAEQENLVTKADLIAIAESIK